MRKYVAAAILALTGGSALAEGVSITPARPAMPTCAILLCLSPKFGMPPPATCIPVRAPYFEIRVYTPKFNPEATAQARKQQLLTCYDGRLVDIERATMRYGRLYNDPIVQ